MYRDIPVDAVLEANSARKGKGKIPLDRLAELLGFDIKGTATVEELSAMTGMQTGDTWAVSDSGTLTLGNLPVVDGQEVIFYVSDDQSVKIWQSSEGNYKIKQASKSDPTASGTAVQFIDSMSQDTNGVVTATKKTVRTATASQTGVTKVYTSTGDSTDGTMTRKAISEAIAAKQPERLVVTPTYSGSAWSNDFATISAAVAAGKDVWARIGYPGEGGVSYSRFIPLTDAVISNSQYTAFIFSLPKPYSKVGYIDSWTCTATSPYWVNAQDNDIDYAVSAGSAGTAANANLSKTTDTTNGDLLYIGTGTQQRVVNAAHATSAKDYDQTGGIATALASKQATITFYGTNTGGTLNNPAISKSIFDLIKESHVIAYARDYADTYDSLTGGLISTVEIDSYRSLDELFLVATNRDMASSNANDRGVSRKIVVTGPLYTGGDVNAQKPEYTLKPNRPYNGPNGNTVPITEVGWRQHVIFELTMHNTSSQSSEKIFLESGGAYQSGTGGYPGQYTQSIITIDGVLYGTPPNPTSWSDSYRYQVAIGSIPANGARTWQVEWWKVRYPGSSSTYYETEYVIVTTIK